MIALRHSPDALIGRLPVIWRALAAILLLGGLILAMVESHARVLRSGTEVRLATAPVDPRDLFRGDYVVLSYQISTLDPVALDGDDSFERRQRIHVRLAPGPDGLAVAKGIYKERPEAAPGEVVLVGRVATAAACLPSLETGRLDCRGPRRGIAVRYGIENYFVPQGSGKAIERTEQARLEIVAAVDAGGGAAIKRLLIDGKLVHQEPPY